MANLFKSFKDIHNTDNTANQKYETFYCGIMESDESFSDIIEIEFSLIKIAEGQPTMTRKFEINALEFEPQFFALSIEENNLEFKNLLATNTHVVIHDEIHSQIEELVKLRNPACRFTQEELSQKIQAEIGTDPIETYGVWVYYPWNNAMVHVLKEEDFIAVRTNRNRYKITNEEQDLLRTKKVGVIGLSVGQSVAVTIAQERSCGELRLCDFDVLELSNYNRIRTRLSNLGLRKTVSVAREIKEMDPFLKVVCFHDGLTPDNMDEFFLGGGKLDVCIDECDDVAMKILSRIKAKKLRVPVVMEASDNCTVDVERFDLEPERSILHGYIDHLDVEKAAQMKTNEEKLPYMMAMLAPEFMTHQMLASIFEINETITTWPQLASSIVYGGGICANVCRRVLLNTFTESGRHQLNVDTYFGDKNSPQKAWTRFQAPKRISEDEMSKVTAKFAPQQRAPSLRSDLEALIKSATKAPSGGNAQQWLWHYHAQKGIFQFIDQSKQTPFLDCAFIASLIGNGAASENLVLAAKSKGIDLKAVFYGHELNQENHLIAHYEFCDAARTHPSPELALQIESRITNRKNGGRTILSASILESLKQVGETVEGCTVYFITDENKLNEFAQIFAQIEMARITDTQGHEDFMHEIRWSEQEEKEKGDGINVWSLDIDYSDYVGILACKQLGALQMLRSWEKGTKLTRLFRKTIDSCSALGIICLPGTSNEDFFKAGRALQRVWLKATELGLAFQPQSPMTLLFYHIANIKNSTMDVQTRQTVQAVQNKFIKVFDMIGSKQGLFVFRLSSTEKKGVPSYRKKLNEVLSIAAST